MRRSLRVILILLFTVLIVIGLIWFIYVLGPLENRLALNSDAGYISSGEKFDVIIGAKRGDVRRRLAKHYFRLAETEEPFPPNQNKMCLGHEYPKYYSIEVYRDESWRRGTLCVVYDSSETVSYLEWAYATFMIDL